MTPAKNVLVIYVADTKQIRSWVVPDFEEEHANPAFAPKADEKSMKIPMDVYRAFSKSEQGYAALWEMQAYINEHG